MDKEIQGENCEKRLHSEAWIRLVSTWASELGGLVLYVKYLFNTPTMQFAFISGIDELPRMLAICPTGAKICAYRSRPQLLHGIVTEDFLRDAMCLFSDNAEYIAMFEPNSSNPWREGVSSNSLSSIFSDLRDELRTGHAVTILAIPRNSVRACTVKDELDGPR